MQILETKEKIIMDEILKHKVENLILSKTEYTEEEIKLILWYLKDKKGNFMDIFLNNLKKLINFINENIKEENE